MGLDVCFSFPLLKYIMYVDADGSRNPQHALYPDLAQLEEAAKLMASVNGCLWPSDLVDAHYKLKDVVSPVKTLGSSDVN